MDNREENLFAVHKFPLHNLHLKTSSAEYLHQSVNVVLEYGISILAF